MGVFKIIVPTYLPHDNIFFILEIRNKQIYLNNCHNDSKCIKTALSQHLFSWSHLIICEIGNKTEFACDHEGN